MCTREGLIEGKPPPAGQNWIAEIRLLVETAVQVALPLTSTFAFHSRRSLTSRWPARSWRCWPWPTAWRTWRSAWGEWWWPVTRTGIPWRQKIWWVRPREGVQSALRPCSVAVRRVKVSFLQSACAMGSQRVLHTHCFPPTSLCVLQLHNVLTAFIARL